ncbi:hypothetical protein GCM10009095_25290 [Sphingomonas molluscorum]|nr:hypothetical protein GCM10017606_00460 [Microbacterium terregens]
MLSALALQLTPEQKATLDAGVKDVLAIDAELEAITEHHDTLRRSRAARLDEIASLRSRYPEIVLTDGATVEQVYKALYAVRVSRAAKLKPLAQEGERFAHQQACQASRRVQEKRAEIEAGEGYKGMSLKDRLDWRESFDGIDIEAECEDVPK